jgi:hypothetical protein
MIAVRRLLIVGLALTALLIPAAPALADHLELETEGAPSVEAGDTVELRVVLRDAESRRRISGAEVLATREATIVGVTDDVVLATATTDELGVATLRWQQRSGADHVVVVAYGSGDDAGFESMPVPVVVVGADRQIVRSASGVQIPGFGAWVLIGVIVAVWAIIQFALIGPVLVASRYEPPDAEGGS